MKPLAMIAAVAKGGVLGLRGELPWRIPEDLRYFKETTLGHAIVMGRKTYATVNKPLPRRRNLVVSRDPGLALEGCETFTSVEAAIEAARATDAFPFVIGGGEIYARALPYATHLYLTEIDRSVEGDAFFPDYRESDFRETSRKPSAEHGDVVYRILERKDDVEIAR